MSAPRYTVIVPMRRYRQDEPALVSLRAAALASPPLEIFVVEGEHPARQRNAALTHARGEIIVFLDNDCRFLPQHWAELETVFARSGVEIVGGPALLRPEATAAEEIFHALLTHPLVVGPVSARYAQRGAFRRATQTELILCNLAARRSLFERIGPLSTHLYPNEESEWLERAQMAGAGIYYDPDLPVFRPQRGSWPAFFLMLLRYGAGRTRQFWVSGWKATRYQLAPLILVLPAALLFTGHDYHMIFGRLWLLGSAVIAVTCRGPLRFWQRLVAGLIAPLIPFAYALGQLVGWPLIFVSPPDAHVTLLNERGEKVG